MLDLVIRNARLPRSDTLRDLAIREGHFVTSNSEEQAVETIDAAGGLVTPALVEPHIHLDAVLTVGQPRYNQSGSLFEGIAIWGDRVRDLTIDDVKQRVRTVLRWQLANGVLFVRSHVDVCDPDLIALRALIELRSEVADQMTLQLVAFPQQGILSFDNGQALMERAVELGADVVGAIPHFELTREYGEQSVKFAMELAARKGLMVDIHCDETDDDQSRFLELMVAETLRLGLQGRVTASHTTAMHSYNNAYAYRLINNVRRAGLNIVTNPLDNSVLQGRFDSYPIRRGHTRVKQLLAEDVSVSIGHDSVMDPWYPLGYADPVQAASVLAHYGQMSGFEELRTLIDMISVNPARALRLPEYGLEAGCRADAVIFGVPTEMDVIRLIAPRRYVIRRGKIVARTEPARHTIEWNKTTVSVDFLRGESTPKAEAQVPLAVPDSQLQASSTGEPSDKLSCGMLEKLRAAVAPITQSPRVRYTALALLGLLGVVVVAIAFSPAKGIAQALTAALWVGLMVRLTYTLDWHRAAIWALIAGLLAPVVDAALVWTGPAIQSSTTPEDVQDAVRLAVMFFIAPIVAGLVLGLSDLYKRDSATRSRTWIWNIQVRITGWLLILVGAAELEVLFQFMPRLLIDVVAMVVAAFLFVLLLPGVAWFAALRIGAELWCFGKSLVKAQWPQLKAFATAAAIWLVVYVGVVMAVGVVELAVWQSEHSNFNGVTAGTGSDQTEVIWAFLQSATVGLPGQGIRPNGGLAWSVVLLSTAVRAVPIAWAICMAFVGIIKLTRAKLSSTSRRGSVAAGSPP